MRPRTPADWRAFYDVAPVNTWVAEAPAPWQRPMPEKLVRCLWFDARWHPPRLRTLAGREFVVHSPGRWNLQAGPDFLQASIAYLDGTRVRGDVEVHRVASGWTAHRHHLNARYNQVILHVVLWNDRQPLMARRADGHAIPQIALADCLPRPLDSYYAEVVLDDYPYKAGPVHGRCYDALRTLAPPDVRDILNRAGDTRLQQRVWRWTHREAEVGLEQVLYEAVLRALGSTGHRQHFQDLSRLLPWSDMQHCLEQVPLADRPLAAEALLLGVAGLLDVPEPGADAETQQYAQELHEQWQRLPSSIQQRAWQHIAWRQPHVRPANTPERRLAGMAHLLVASEAPSLLEAALAVCRRHAPATTPTAKRALGTALTTLLEKPTASYWARRAHLGSRPGPVQRLIGRQRALTVVVDALVPVLLIAAQRQADTGIQDALLAWYQQAPRLPDNHLLRYMCHRMLGNEPAFLRFLTGARQQQGLLQLFADFCSNDEGDCQGCGFVMPGNGDDAIRPL